MTATIGSLSLVIGVLYGKLATLRLGFDILTRSMNVVRVLPALWGMVTGSVSLLRRYRGAVQSGWSYRGCACRSCRSYLKILGSHQGIFCRGVQRDYGKADPVARNLNGLVPFFDAIGSGSAVRLTGLNAAAVDGVQQGNAG